ncbi:hypothetical protein L484_011312 [Morus notabilis]|uniref:Uncharacterized protein n=1 Tax=Morus notabilis TaxID=981085 RepID=W9SGQ5_9ROSA|nr:hypothetical protein L484_011312 [Morus notabilis]
MERDDRKSLYLQHAKCHDEPINCSLQHNTIAIYSTIITSVKLLDAFSPCVGGVYHNQFVSISGLIITKRMTTTVKIGNRLAN